MNPAPVRYRSPDEDSGRWLEFEFRPNDVVISTRSKSGTTWDADDLFLAGVPHT
ncbi:MAG TPA: hypothetical protein VES40_12960 [Ilumatobacteraceae bacterium]|nr:hypothetical protein [Ilumatobacteraceae bacterium]